MSSKIVFFLDGNDKIIGVGCSGHFLHNANQYAADVDVQSCCLSIRAHFEYSMNRREKLLEFCDAEKVTLLSHFSSYIFI